jgi:hypothetical protein
MRHKQSLSLSEQIEQVRRIGESRMPPLIVVGCGTACALGILLFSWIGNQTPGFFTLLVAALFVSAVCGIVSLAVLADFPRFRRIARATRSGRRVRGDIQITVDRSDPENTRIRGCMMEGGAVWDLQFTRPLGWEPRSGEWPCELVFLADVRLPVMVQLADGLLFTSDRTQRVYGRRA